MSYNYFISFNTQLPIMPLVKHTWDDSVTLPLELIDEQLDIVYILKITYLQNGDKTVHIPLP